MSKNGSLVLCLASVLSFANLAYAGGPCMDKVQAKHASRKALHECIEGWAKDARPADSDPTDDCSAKLTAFTSAAKDVKACRTAARTKK